MTPNPTTMTLLIQSPKHGDFRVLFDAADSPIVLAHTWCVSKEPSRAGGRQFHVASWINKKMQHLHRVLMSPPAGLQVDHINGQPLDNRRCNLRVVTNQENSWNMVSTRGYSRHHKRWQARIKVDGRSIHLGVFDTEDEARAAYLAAKAIYHVIKS